MALGLALAVMTGSVVLAEEPAPQGLLNVELNQKKVTVNLGGLAPVAGDTAEAFDLCLNASVLGDGTDPCAGGAGGGGGLLDLGVGLNSGADVAGIGSGLDVCVGLGALGGGSASCDVSGGPDNPGDPANPGAPGTPESPGCARRRVR